MITSVLFVILIGMEVDGDSAEITEGVLLQKLWLKLRSYALDETGMGSFSLSTSDTPPSPYSLLVGMQEHLYPFFQSLALFYHSISGIKFVHSSGIIIMITTLTALTSI